MPVDYNGILLLNAGYRKHQVFTVCLPHVYNKVQHSAFPLKQKPWEKMSALSKKSNKEVIHNLKASFHSYRMQNWDTQQHSQISKMSNSCYGFPIICVYSLLTSYPLSTAPLPLWTRVNVSCMPVCVFVCRAWFLWVLLNPPQLVQNPPLLKEQPTRHTRALVRSVTCNATLSISTWQNACTNNTSKHCYNVCK